MRALPLAQGAAGTQRRGGNLRSQRFLQPGKSEVPSLALLDMAHRGLSLQPAAVLDELTRRGELNRVGGPTTYTSASPPCHQWPRPGTTPVSSPNVPPFRRLVEAGQRIVQYADGTGINAFEVAFEGRLAAARK